MEGEGERMKGGAYTCRQLEGVWRREGGREEGREGWREGRGGGEERLIFIADLEALVKLLYK